VPALLLLALSTTLAGCLQEPAPDYTVSPDASADGGSARPDAGGARADAGLDGRAARPSD
jgi:hypothetical protein